MTSRSPAWRYWSMTTVFDWRIDFSCVPDSSRAPSIPMSGSPALFSFLEAEACSSGRHFCSRPRSSPRSLEQVTTPFGRYRHAVDTAGIRELLGIIPEVATPGDRPSVRTDPGVRRVPWHGLITTARSAIFLQRRPGDTAVRYSYLGVARLSGLAAYAMALHS